MQMSFQVVMRSPSSLTEESLRFNKQSQPGQHWNEQVNLKGHSVLSANDLENGFLTEKLYNSYVRVDMMLFASLLIDIVLLISYFEHSIDSSVDQSDTLGYIGNPSYFFLDSSVIFMLVTIVLTVMRYRLKAKIVQFQKTMSEGWNSLFFELLVLLIHPVRLFESYACTMALPYGDTSVFISMKINHIILMCACLRILFILRSLVLWFGLEVKSGGFHVNLAKYSTPSTRRICKMFHCDYSFVFIFRSLFKDYPIIILMTLVILIIAIFSYLIRICEINYEAGAFSFRSYSNALWFTFISISTVGFGDIYPRTTIGIYVNLLMLITGVSVMALTLGFMSSSLSLSERERRCLKTLHKLQINREMMISATKFIRLAFARGIARRQAYQNFEDASQYEEPKMEERKELMRLRNLKGEYQQQVNDKEDLHRNMALQFQVVFSQVEEIYCNTAKIKKQAEQKESVFYYSAHT